MSSIVNKVKEAVHGHKSSEPEGTHGHHDSRAANAADPRIDSDRDGRAAPRTTGGFDSTTTGTHGTHGTHGITGTHGTTGVTGSNYTTSTNAGPHDSNAANKLDPRVDSDRDNSRTVGGNNYGTTGTTGMTGTHGTTGTHGSSGLTGNNYNTSTNAGPHDSNVANKLDPRVDSDRDGSRTAGGNTYGSSGVTGTHGTTGTHGSSGLTGNNYNTSTNAGPHDSNVANKLDPRVDSDRDGSRTAGGNTYGTSGVTGTHGTHGTHGTTGMTGTHGSSGLTGSNYNTSTNAGPHDSNVANKLDPRVDSDRDGSRTAGGNTYGTSGVTGTHGSSGLTGSHGTHGTTGTHGSHGLTSGPGPAPNTAGPHKSDALNKMDPRVDSDRDGSKTLGQDKTYHADPTDAAQVPPSTLRKHIGEPEVAHDDHHHGRDRRNSKPSAQEGHRGL